MLAGLGLGLALAAPAFAQGTIPYDLELGAGESRARIDQNSITADLAGKGRDSSASSGDWRGAAYKLFCGYQLNRNFALEAV